MATARRIERVTAASNCLFDQPWWLDAVAPGKWDEVVLEDGIRARWPYVVRRRFGLTALTHPPLTPTLGPCIAGGEGGYANTLAREHRALSELVELLPRFDVFRQAFHPSLTNWLPLYWSGFEATVHYTYRLADLSDLDRVWDGLHPSARRAIRKAQRSVTVRTDLGLDAFLAINEMTFRRQRLPLPYTPELVERLDHTCADRDARRIFFAVDERDQLHAALYLVWDERSAYLLMSGGDPELRMSGAGSLLAWEAIRFAAGVTRSFDFEGSMLPAVERFFRGFGARQVPYLVVTKANARGRTAQTARRAAARVRPPARAPLVPAPMEREQARIRRVFAAYEANARRRRAWDPERPGNRRIIAEFYDALAARLRAEDVWPDGDRALLDIGCGDGPVLEGLLVRGAAPAALHGVDLRADVIARAHERLPGVDARVADARALPYPSSSVDAVVVATVLSSVLDPANRARICTEALRVLRPGGRILVYDLRVPNPANRHVRAITAARLRRLFPGAAIDARTLTLLPQLARGLGPAADLLYGPLARLRFLRTHLLTVVRPGPSADAAR